MRGERWNFDAAFIFQGAGHVLFQNAWIVVFPGMWLPLSMMADYEEKVHPELGQDCVLDDRKWNLVGVDNRLFDPIFGSD